MRRQCQLDYMLQTLQIILESSKNKYINDYSKLEKFLENICHGNSTAQKNEVFH